MKICFHSNSFPGISDWVGTNDCNLDNIRCYQDEAWSDDDDGDDDGDDDDDVRSTRTATM